MAAIAAKLLIAMNDSSRRPRRPYPGLVASAGVRRSLLIGPLVPPRLLSLRCCQRRQPFDLILLSPRGSKKPDHRHCGLLRAPCERPGGRRTAHHFDEIAPSHAALPGASDRAKRSRRIAQVS